MLLIGNGVLIARDDKNTFLSNGGVVTEGKLIKAVGKTEDLKAQFPDAEFIDAKGGLIMPGLINMHEHIYSSFARGLSIKGYDPKGFLDVLEGQWWKIDRNLNLKDDYHSAKVAYLDSIKSGVTTVFDHHASYGQVSGSLHELSKAADEYGIRTCLCYEVSDRDGEEKAVASVKENIDFIKEAAKRNDDMQYGMVGIHAAFTVSDKTFELCRSEMPDDVGFHIHVAEGMTDVLDSLHKYNKPIVNRLFDLGVLGEKTLAVHGIHINPHEMELLRDTNTMLVTNPESNMGNAVGTSPVLRMWNEYGILVGLGTDGYTHDMIESYKVGNLIQKDHLCDPTVAWGEIPTFLFDNNHKQANRYFKTKLGVLEAGAAADVIIMDYKAPTPINENNYNMHILFGTNGKHVTDTIINGEVKMRNRELVGMDEDKIWADAQQQAADLWSRINA